MMTDSQDGQLHHRRRRIATKNAVSAKSSGFLDANAGSPNVRITINDRKGNRRRRWPRFYNCVSNQQDGQYFAVLALLTVTIMGLLAVLLMSIEFGSNFSLRGKLEAKGSNGHTHSGRGHHRDAHELQRRADDHHGRANDAARQPRKHHESPDPPLADHVIRNPKDITTNAKVPAAALGAIHRVPENEVAEEVRKDHGIDGDKSNKNSTQSEHYWVVKKILVNVHNTSLPENYALVGDLGALDAAGASDRMVDRISSSITDRIEKIFENTKTDECRAKVGEAFAHYINAIGKEESLPFANVKFKNGCLFPEADINPDEENEVDPDEEQRRFDEAEEKSWSYQPSHNEAEYIDDPKHLNILYGILTHGEANETIRLINALYEDGHLFVVHVDGKEIADETYLELSQYAATRDYIHILPDRYRVRVNWGGFSMVNATMQLMRYAMATDRAGDALAFHKFVHLSATTYPIKSNKKIRHVLSEYPIDANFHWMNKQPSSPHEESWYYFVECDDAVHRIHRLPPKRWENSGIDIMTSSQWHISSREFVEYMAEARPGTFIHEYLQYIEHVVVADEQFFGTVLRHTKFCHKHERTNFLYLEFGDWEDSRHNTTKARDSKKCLMPNPEKCGRSPIELTKHRIMALDISDTQDLFARKFAHKENDEVKDAVDTYLRDETIPRADLSFEGYGAMIVAKDTLHADMPLCLALGPKGNSSIIHLMPCFHRQHEAIEKTSLEDGWYQRPIKLDDTVPRKNRFKIGKCSVDGNLTLGESGEIQVTPGVVNPAGPRCFIKVEGKKYSHCLGSKSLNKSEAVGHLVSTHCKGDWRKTFFFGDGMYAPKSTLHLMVPKSMRKMIEDDGRNQESHICLGVLGRGQKDEEVWNLPEIKNISHTNSKDEQEYDIDDSPSLTKYLDVMRIQGLSSDHGAFTSLQAFAGERIVTTKCSNRGAILEWIVVPYVQDKKTY